MTKPVGAYTPIVRAGDWLIVSGQVGVFEGELVAGGFHGQLTQALDNLEALLQGEGAELSHVVKTTVFLRHMGDYDLLNDVWSRRFGESPPARAAFAVSELPLHALVEVEAWAYTGA
jgi:2-iminobutanoate/2-iminopropanoate deaminase